MVPENIKNKLESIYSLYHDPAYLSMDPLQCVHSFESGSQKEIAGLVCAVLAYGRFEIIIRNSNRVFEIMNRKPVEFVHETSFKEKMSLLKGFKHRFNDSFDIALLLESVGEVIDEYGSIETFFKSFHKDKQSIKNTISMFIHEMKSRASNICGFRKKSFEYLLPSPQSGSACKRMNMYFRWMIRKDDGIDLGIWKNLPSSMLIIPVDTHIAQIARKFGLSKRKSVDWVMAEEITLKLREVDSEDPVRFDFSLCREGMVNFRKDAA